MVGVCMSAGKAGVVEGEQLVGYFSGCGLLSGLALMALCVVPARGQPSLFAAAHVARLTTLLIKVSATVPFCRGHH